MKLVVGLGNPGRRYSATRHNVGFEVIDVLAGMLGCRLRKSLRFRASIGKAVWGSQELWIVKPATYMNQSGLAVGSIARRRKLAPSDVVVVVDDADLETGRIRIRPGGGSGGHRGLVSVAENLGTDGFQRIRIGIGRGGEEELKEHVLGRIPDRERAEMGKTIKTAADAVLCVVEQGIEAAMNRYNVKR